MIVFGIDPGKSGALVAVDVAGGVRGTFELEFDKAGLLEVGLLAKAAHEHRPHLVIIERVRGRGVNPNAEPGGFRGWGATQNFNFGFVYGQLVATLLCLQPTYGFGLQFVEPQAWQKLAHAGCPHKMPAKDATAWAYGALYPTAPIPTNRKGVAHDGMVDALFIARWGLAQLRG